MQADLAVEPTRQHKELRILHAILRLVSSILMDDDNELNNGRHRIIGKKSKRGTNSRSLPEHVLKTLAQDIEAAGGIGGRESRRPFNLPRICEKREDIYGAPDSSRRKAIQNKVDRWRKLTRAEYSTLLQSLNVRYLPPSSPLLPSPCGEELPLHQLSPPQSTRKKTARSTQKPTTPSHNSASSISRANMTPRRKFDDLDGKFLKG
jgi:hypothetical protein